jgi:cell division protein FtsL
VPQARRGASNKATERVVLSYVIAFAFPVMLHAEEGQIYNKLERGFKTEGLLQGAMLRGGNALVLLVAAALFGYLSLSIVGRAVQIYRLNVEIGQLKSEIQGIEERYQEMQVRREYVGSEAYVEKVAREQLGLIKLGDRAVIVVATGDAYSTQARPDEPAIERVPAWRRWWRSLRGGG